MKIGFLTNCLEVKSIKEAASWAKENGFEALEAGPSVSLDEGQFSQAMKETGIEIIAFIYCRNFQSLNPKERQEYYDNLMKRINFASKIGIKYVTTSTGIDETKSIEENIEIFKRFFIPIVEEAEKFKIAISLENCPAMGNIAISPYMWRKVFQAIPSDNLKLTFDPSHLVWQGINCYRALEEFVDRVAYVHIKDTEIVADVLKDRGILHSKDFGQNIWWRHRLPGWGEIDWKRIITILMENKFDGVLSIEHEDPVWSGSEERVKEGLLKARDFIQDFM